MPTIQVNDIQMYYEIHGAGQPLVIIGGLGLDISEFTAIIQWFARKYRVLAFDNRGAGRTDKPDIPYSIEMMAADTVGLMNALAIEHASILGISMGGRIALELALRHPEKVERLVLVSTSARVVRTKWGNVRLHLLSRFATLPLFAGKYPQPHYAHKRQRQASTTYNCTARLHELRMPTLILHGKQDKTAVYSLAQEMHAGIDGSKMLTFEGGHIFFLFSERQGFLEATADFLGS